MYNTRGLTFIQFILYISNTKNFDIPKVQFGLKPSTQHDYSCVQKFEHP